MKQNHMAFLAAAFMAAFSLPAWAQVQTLFSPRPGGTSTIAATTASASVTLTGEQLNDNQLRFIVEGANNAYCRWGIGAQTATTADLPVNPNYPQVFPRVRADTIACITATGTTTVRITTGNNGF